MIYITNQLYVSVVTYVTITSNRMIVPTTSINYIKHSTIKGLFDKSDKKNTILSYISHALLSFQKLYVGKEGYILYYWPFFHVSVVITCVTIVTLNLMISENHE